MAEKHDPNQLVGAAPDIAPLAWVIDEIRTSLAEAVSGLKAFIANKQDLDSVRNARNQIHQANGALQLLDLRGVALVTEAIEQLTRRYEAEPKECSPAPIRIIETALSAVMAYLDGLLSGRPNQPIKLFPYYRDVLQLSQASRVHPADLVFPDLSRRPAFHQIEARNFTPRQLRDRRARFELGLLGFLRNSDDAAPRKRMREALSDLEHMPQRGLARSFWWIARGLLEALEAGAVGVDVDLKRVLARLNLQLRRMIEGGGAVAERLMVDALYYVGRAQGTLPRVVEVKRLYGLDALIPADFERASLTALDADALRALKEALVQAKQLWGQIVAGSPDSAKFEHEIALARETSHKLHARPLVAAFEAIARVTQEFAKLAPNVREAVGLEVASALLFVDLGVEELPQIEAEYEGRALQVIDRLGKARNGQPLPQAGPWMSELARRAQDRLTMGTVVAETQATLRDIEQRLDRFFRNPLERADLPATTAMFDQVCGVLSLLGYDEPVAALRNVQTSIARFSDATVAPEPDEFGRIAQNLGAVGFFVESVGQDADRPRGMFRYDPVTGIFSADLGQLQSSDTVSALADDDYIAPRTVDIRLPDTRRGDNVESAARKTLAAAHVQATRLRHVAGDARAIEELERLLPTLANEADLLDNERLKQNAARATHLLGQLKETHAAHDAAELEQLLAPLGAAEAPKPTAPLPVSEAAADDELRQIFVEEARDVLDSIVEQLEMLRTTRDDQTTLTTVRRAFHTLKGSSRMVGFKTVGEGAWGVEQCFNLWLAQERAASDDLLDLAAGAQRIILDWISQIANDPAAEPDPTALVRAAQAVREGGAFEYPHPLPGMPPVPKSDGSAPAAAMDALPWKTNDANRLAGARPAEQLIEGSPTHEDIEAAAPPLEVTAAEHGLEFKADSEAVETVAAGVDQELGSEEIKRVGPLDISHGLYSIFLTEADECIRVLANDIAEWRYEPTRAVTPNIMRRAHSLSGISKTVGLAPVVAIAEPLDDLMRTLTVHGTRHLALTPAQFDTLERVTDRVRGMLHQFAAGIYPDEAPLEAGALHDLVSVVRAHSSLHNDMHPSSSLHLVAADPIHGSADADADLEIEVTDVSAADVATPDLSFSDLELADVDAAEPLADEEVVAEPVDDAAESREAPPRQEEAEEAADDRSDTTSDGEQPSASRLRDELDADLLEVFLTEAAELLPSVATNLRGLASNTNDAELARDLMRKLHTVKGSARMAGAMRLGEAVHEMETRMEAAMQLSDIPPAIIDDLHTQYDHAMALYDELQNPAASSVAPSEVQSAGEPSRAPVIDIAAKRADGKPDQRVDSRPIANVVPLSAASLASPGELSATLTAATPGAQPAATFIRVRADVLDKLVDQAGEVSIARSKLENEVGTIKGSLVDLTENISRLRAQLREVEIQADAQIQARGDKLSRESADFDPLEFDRYTRLQELTRMLAESVEDVAMVQSNMLKGLQSADTDLTSQSRLTRDLQQQLMRVRLVPFSNVSERLYRVARQAAKELDKRVNLDIRGAATELDRGVLEKMAGPFEHLIRNAIVHGLEGPADRRAAGKPETGELMLDVRQEGNEIIVVINDDGAGLNLKRIQARAIERQLVTPDQVLGDRELMELIFQPGFTTATEVTELAGRGVGMDVVRAELASFGGRISISSESGRGTRFTLYLPMTLAIAQVVLVGIAGRRYAIPAGMVEQVRRYRPAVLLAALTDGLIEIPPVGAVVLRPLTQLLGEETTPHLARQTPVVLLRSGDDRLAIAVDEVSSNQEVVVKSVGVQVARMAGILGATILGNGEIVLIINPVQLITRAPEPPAVFDVAPDARDEAKAAQKRIDHVTELSTSSVPTVMVVDDSLTVRRVTQRLLERQGYTVLLAKDGVDALRQLQEIKPDIMLVDIEMPRMDGYDLTRNVRGNMKTADIPIIMITSRTAEKHRKMAFELGVNEYLGKPYQEDELLKSIKQYLSERVTA
ncbi:MAG: Hpt domain-containing protein [Burkholderiaceae bacterium]